MNILSMKLAKLFKIIIIYMWLYSKIWHYIKETRSQFWSFPPFFLLLCWAFNPSKGQSIVSVVKPTLSVLHVFLHSNLTHYSFLNLEKKIFNYFPFYFYVQLWTPPVALLLVTVLTQDSCILISQLVAFFSLRRRILKQFPYIFLC